MVGIGAKRVSKEDVGQNMDYIDFEIQKLFEGICEQVLDYLGIDDGRDFLYHNFVGFENAIDIKIADFQKGNRITEKTEITDESIKKICEGWKE